MKELVVLVMLLWTVASIGCATIEGAGKDIERGGEKIQETAKEVRQKI